MTVERLGIVEALQERNARFAHIIDKQAADIRRRIMYSGPTTNGAYSDLTNPFDRTDLAFRLKIIGTPFFENRTHRLQRSTRNKELEAAMGISPVRLIQAVLLETGYTPEDLLGRAQPPRLTLARHVAVWLADRYCPAYSLPQLGVLFDRDHTTILYSIRSIDRRLDFGERQVVELVAAVKARLHHE